MIRPPLRYTLIQAEEPPRLTKAFSIGPDGKIASARAGELIKGVVHAAQAADLPDLFQQLQALPPSCAVSWGRASAIGAPVVCREYFPKPPGAITRTKDHFKFDTGPGVMMIDHDETAPGTAPLTVQQLVGELIKVCPALADAPLLARPSASAGVCLADTTSDNPQAGRWRLYVPVSNASKIPEAGKRLGRLLQAAGHAWAVVSKSGQIMQRTLVDQAVWSPERLDFAAPPVCGPGIQRTPPQSLIFNELAEWFDLNRIKTTAETDAAAAVVVASVRASVRAEAQARRAEWVEANAPRIAAKTGRTVDQVREAYELALEGGELPPWFELRLRGGEVVSVADVTRRWPEHEGARLCDPFEPDRDDGDDRIAFIFKRLGVPWIHSHAGGGIEYQLHVDEQERTASAFKDAEPPCIVGSLRSTPPTPPTAPQPVTLKETVEAPTDDALALAFVDLLAPRYRFTPGMGWMFNLGTAWERDERKRHFDDARQLCRAVGKHGPANERKRVESAKTVAAVVTMAAADQRIVLDANAWDADPAVLNTPGGLVDLRTGQVCDRAGHYLTQCTAVAPDPTADAPTFKRFMREVFCGDADTVSFMQRALGYCMTGEIREQVLFFWHGTGSNGKNTLLDLIQWLTGTYSLKLPADTLMNSRNERHPTGIAQLLGKRLAVSSELDEGQFFNEPLMKELTGDQYMRARFMGRDFFTFHQTQKHIIVGNFRPRLRGGDPAIARRMVLVPFEAVFPANRKDPLMLEKLKVEGPAVLGWLIQGAIQWHREGLGIPPAVRAASADYMQAHDDLKMWLDECCTLEGETKAGDLYASFRGWKDRRGEHASSQTAWGDRMTQLQGMRKRISNGVRYSPISLRPVAWPGAA